MLRKIFPFDAESSFYNSFNVIFISEGFLSSESALFTSLCLDFTKKLLETAPFNLTRINSNWLSIYTSFAASSNKGPILNSAAVVNRTAFEATVNTTTGLMTFNHTKINNHLAAETFSENEQTSQLSDILGKGYPNMGHTGTLVVVLLPPLSAHPAGADFEPAYNDSNYHFVATTADGYWHQVVIRGICKVLGLGDEFELPGSDYLSPDDDARKGLIGHFNIQYFDTAPATVTSKSKWYPLFSVTAQGMAAEVRGKTGDTSVPDNSISTELVSYDTPVYYEGGGGYRTKVYRSCKDSLLRRKIGSPELPLRNMPLALSPPSVQFIKNLIL